jgi:hypothetical protein
MMKLVRRATLTTRSRVCGTMIYQFLQVGHFPFHLCYCGIYLNICHKFAAHLHFHTNCTLSSLSHPILIPFISSSYPPRPRDLNPPLHSSTPPVTVTSARRPSQPCTAAGAGNGTPPGENATNVSVSLLRRGVSNAMNLPRKDYSYSRVSDVRCVERKR